LLSTPLVATTDANGAFAWEPVPTGVYQVRATSIAHRSEDQTVTVTAHDPLDPVTLDIDLEPATLVWDFESGMQGWTVVQPSDGATAGQWVWSDPVGSGVGLIQPENDHTPNPGIRCFVTGNAALPGAAFNTADVDGGRTIVQSPVFNATGVTSPRLRYWRWFSNNAGPNGSQDSLRVQLSSNGGSTWTTVELVTVTQAAWTEVTVPIASPTANMRIRFAVADRGNDSTVEAAIDDVSLLSQTPTDVAIPGAVTRLLPNVPNPFNPSTRLRFELATAGPVQVAVYSASGAWVRTLVDETRPAGSREVLWDGRDSGGHAVASGTYFVRLKTTSETLSQRVVLVR
jgi:hypothetical protein